VPGMNWDLNFEDEIFQGENVNPHVKNVNYLVNVGTKVEITLLVIEIWDEKKNE
jgi:pyruvate-formate lyase-activating enzyme